LGGKEIADGGSARVLFTMQQPTVFQTVDSLVLTDGCFVIRAVFRHYDFKRNGNTGSLFEQLTNKCGTTVVVGRD